MEGKKRQTERSGNRRRGGCIGAGVAASRDGRSVGRKADRGGGGKKQRRKKKNPGPPHQTLCFPFLTLRSGSFPTRDRVEAEKQQQRKRRWKNGMWGSAVRPAILSSWDLRGCALPRVGACAVKGPSVLILPCCLHVPGYRGCLGREVSLLHPLKQGEKGAFYPPPGPTAPESAGCKVHGTLAGVGRGPGDR